MENQVFLNNQQIFFEAINKNKYDELRAIFEDERQSPWLYSEEEKFTGIKNVIKRTSQGRLYGIP